MNTLNQKSNFSNSKKKLKIHFTILYFSILLLLLQNFTPAMAWPGRGTADSPYQISSVADLQMLATNCNNGNSYSNNYIILTADLDLSSVCGEGIGSWTPIGFDDENSMAGHFDGNGHTISNLYIIGSPNWLYYGLFGRVIWGEISNINLVNTTLIINKSSSYVGALCGSIMSAHINNVHLENTNISVFSSGTSDNSTYVGAICGYNDGATISNCSNNGTIYGGGYHVYVGGISGWGFNINNCTNSGSVAGIGVGEVIVGGIGGSISNLNYCTNNSEVNGIHEGTSNNITAVGGIVGRCNSSPSIGLITCCINNGKVQGIEISCGGIIGNVSNVETNILYSVNSGSVYGSKKVGGISGKGACSYCINVGKVSGTDSTVGGISGYDGYDISSCIYDKQMSPISNSFGRGLLTSEMIGALLKTSQFGTGYSNEIWNFSEGMYPRPRGIDTSSVAVAYATPIFLTVIDSNNYETVDNILNNFTVGTGNNVAWSNQSENITFEGNNALVNCIANPLCDSIKVSRYGVAKTINLQLNKINKTNEVSISACDSSFWNDQVYTESGDYEHNFTMNNGCDSMVTLHLTINNSETNEISETVCDEYIWNGQSYTQSGDYIQTLINENGCDSTVTLHLTVKYSSTQEMSETVCDSYTWNGITYTESGDYVQTFVAANGCDFVVTLHLTVNNSSNIEFSETVCDSYTWNGETYTQSGDYVQSFVKTNGCDSIVTLHLTVNNSASYTFSHNACDSYSWNGQTYTESGTYTQNFQTTHGCDSVVTLLLTISSSTSFTFSNTACDSYTWNGQVYTLSGTYMQFFQTINGCDSMVTLFLTILNSAASNLYETACDVYSWNNQTYTESGDYVQNYVAANGCDSTVTLHLTVYNSTTHSFSATACNDYIWNDQTYTQSGDYEQLLQTVAGCDSIVTLHLTMNFSATSEFSETVCDEFIWNDQTYTLSGDYVQQFLTVAGCDSVVTLHLTVNYSTESEFSAAGCNEYVWNNETYTQSGDYIQQFQTVAGCDSIVTLHLTINYSVTNEFSATACDEYVWNNQTYTQSGDYEQQFQTIAGCDSTVTLHLTIHSSYETTISDAICFGSDYTENGFEILQPEVGTHTETLSLESQFGCDSVIALTLTVNELPAVEILGETEIEQGESTTLTASGAATYLWSTGETTASITVSPNETTTYSVVGTDENGCEGNKEITVSVLLGVPQIDAATYKIYPNPTDALVMIEGEDIQSVEIYNSIGKRCHEIKSTQNSLKINTSGFESGVYLVRITTMNGSVITKRLIIAR